MFLNDNLSSPKFTAMPPVSAVLDEFYFRRSFIVDWIGN